MSRRAPSLSAATPAPPPEAPAPIPSHELPTGVVHIPEALARQMIRLALAGIEPAMEMDDWEVILSCSRREVERMRSSGKLPPPDFHIGKLPRWRPATVRRWLEGGD